MHIKKCRECGFAYWFSRMTRWNDNGTITYSLSPSFRIVLIESDLLSDIFSRIEERLGLSISHLVFEAQRNASREFVDLNLNGFPFSLGRIGPNKHLVVRVFRRLSIWMGTAYIGIIQYRPGRIRPGRIGEAIIRNPYNRELMAAIILGALESLERRPFQHSWRKEGGDDIISISVAEEKPEVSERLGISPPPMKPGNRALPRCPSCGVPRDIAYLEWREEEGMIIDTRRGVRVNFLDGYAPQIVFRELEKELGEDIYPLIVQAGKEYTHNRLRDLDITKGGKGKATPEERGSFYEMSLASLPLWGQGNPVSFKQEEGLFDIIIDNPYNEHLLAGHVAALFEAVEGVKAEVTWESPEPSTTIFTVRAVK